MTINRITPEMVKEAYQSTGMEPIQEFYIMPQKKCCCALSAVALHKEGVDFVDKLEKAFHKRDLLIDTLLLNRRYANGFISGFDDREYIPFGKPNEWDIGYKDGSAVREAVLK
jgi:hypothetical protein